MCRALCWLMSALLLVSVLAGCGPSQTSVPTPDSEVGTKEPTSAGPSTQKQGLPTSAAETQAPVKTPDELPVLEPEPRDDNKAWDNWLDGRTRQVTEWLTRPEIFDWTEEQLGKALQAKAYRNEESPYRIVQLGPLQMPAGTLQYTGYWIQWRDGNGKVHAQQLYTEDSGLHKGYRVFETEGGSVLILLLNSVLGGHNSSVWAWRLVGETWVPMEGSFDGVKSADVSQLFLGAEGGGLGVYNKGDGEGERFPYVYFHETVHTPHAILCGVFWNGATLDCYKVAWNGQRFQLDPKLFWGTGPGDMECEDLAFVGIPRVGGLEASSVEAALGKPAAKRTEGKTEHWEYPNLGLTLTMEMGKAYSSFITRGALTSGLQVGDSRARAIELHGKPTREEGAILYWEYSHCAFEVWTKIENGQITVIGKSPGRFAGDV